MAPRTGGAVDETSGVYGQEDRSDIAGQAIHIRGINTPPPSFSKRVLGMRFTFNTLITLLFANLGWSLSQLYS